MTPEEKCADFLRKIMLLQDFFQKQGWTASHARDICFSFCSTMAQCNNPNYESFEKDVLLMLSQAKAQWKDDA